MLIPTLGDQTSSSQIEVKWTSLTGLNTGGTPITSYHLQKEIGTNIWEDIVGATTPYTLLSNLIIDNIVGG